MRITDILTEARDADGNYVPSGKSSSSRKKMQPKGFTSDSFSYGGKTGGDARVAWVKEFRPDLNADQVDAIRRGKTIKQAMSPANNQMNRESGKDARFNEVVDAAEAVGRKASKDDPEKAARAAENYLKGISDFGGRDDEVETARKNAGSRVRKRLGAKNTADQHRSGTGGSGSDRENASDSVQKASIKNPEKGKEIVKAQNEIRDDKDNNRRRSTVNNADAIADGKKEAKNRISNSEIKRIKAEIAVQKDIIKNPTSEAQAEAAKAHLADLEAKLDGR